MMVANKLQLAMSVGGIRVLTAMYEENSGRTGCFVVGGCQVARNENETTLGKCLFYGLCLSVLVYFHC